MNEKEVQMPLLKNHVAMIALGLNLKDVEENRFQEIVKSGYNEQYPHNLAKIWYFDNLRNSTELKKFLVNQWQPLLNSNLRKPLLEILDIFRGFCIINQKFEISFNCDQLIERLQREIHEQRISFFELKKIAETLNYLSEEYSSFLISEFIKDFCYVLEQFVYYSQQSESPNDCSLWKKIDNHWHFVGDSK